MNHGPEECLCRPHVGGFFLLFDEWIFSLKFDGHISSFWTQHKQNELKFLESILRNDVMVLLYSSTYIFSYSFKKNSFESAVFLINEFFFKGLSIPNKIVPLICDSLSMVSVTEAQPWWKNIQFPQSLTSSALGIQLSTSSWLHDPGSPEADDHIYCHSDILSEGQQLPHSMSQCLHHSPHFTLSHRHFVISCYHKKGEYNKIKYFERYHIYITFITLL